MRAVSVVAGGWSFSRVPHELIPGPVIAINDTAIFLRRRCNYIVSMDRLWTEHRWADLCAMQISTYIWRPVAKNVDTNNKPWLTLFDCDNNTVRFSPAELREGQQPYCLNGTNSGVCGINKAYHLLEPGDELYLFGFDMKPGPCGERHWYPDYKQTNGDAWKTSTSNGKFKEWSRQFDQIAAQFAARNVKVFNVSEWTSVRSFPVLTVKQLRERTEAWAQA